MMADNKNLGNFEGEPYATIQFKIVKDGVVAARKMIDCDLAGPSIIGLKEDLADWFGAPAEMQQWYFKGKLLKDSDTLWSAGICNFTELEIEVVVA